MPDFKKHASLAEFIHEPVKIPRSMRALIGSYARRIPLNVFRTCSEILRQRIAEIAHRYDLIFCDHYEVFQYVPSDYRGRIVLHEHNAYFLMWRRYAQSGGNPVMRLASYSQTIFR